MVTYSSPLVVAAQAEHKATVVFLHGLGDSGAGWEDAAMHWARNKQLKGVKFVLPNAPEIPITVNGGYVMPGWFDVKALGGDLEQKRKNEDEPGILQSTEYVHSLVQSEIDNGIPAEKIVVGGFSQGGAIGIISGLTAKVKLSGILMLSTFFPLSLRLPALLPQPELNKQTPIFVAHGEVDPVIPVATGRESYDELKRQGYNATFKTYPGMAHSASLQEMNDVEAFLIEVLGDLNKDDPGKSEL